VALLTLSASAAACGPDVREPEVARDGEAHFSIATFNVYAPASSDLATVEAVGGAGADIVCLQEVSPSWEGALHARYSSHFPYRILRSAGGASGLGVLSRFPLEDEGVIAGMRRGFKPAMVVRVETPLGWVRILNLHLRSRQLGTGNAIERYLGFPADQEAEIRHLWSSLPDGQPTVIVGDFNEEEGGRALSWLARKGFQNALPLFAPGAPTWRGRSVAGQLELTVDHILFDRSFESLAARTLNGGSSDHSPVVAVFRAPRR